MMDNPAETLLAEINLFIERSGISPTAFGKLSVGDPNLVRTLRAGREPRFNRAKRIYEFIASQRETAA